MSNPDIEKTPLCTAGLVLGIIGLCTSFIPIVNNVSIILGVLAVVFGLISIRKAGKEKLVATIVIGVLTVIIAVNAKITSTNSLNASNDTLNTVTEQVLTNYLDIDMRKFEIFTDVASAEDMQNAIFNIVEASTY